MLKVDKAHGDDGLAPIVLNQLATELKGVSQLINPNLYYRSIQEGKIPSDWKSANVTPIFKKGRKCEAGITDRLV